MPNALRVGSTLICSLLLTTAYAQMTFPWTRHTIDNTSWGADGTKVYFANQDSLPDVISGWEQGGVTRLYFHPGDPTQEWPYIEVLSPAVEDALLADLDEDGFPDIITLSEGQHQRITVHWAPNNWQQYQQSSAWQSVDIPCTVHTTQWMFGVAHQVDGVNGLDLIVGSKNKGGTLGWLEAPANPRIVDQWQFYEISPAGWIMSIEIVDVNRDGYSDILISDRKGNNRGVRWLEYPAQQDKLRAQWNNHIIGLTQGEPMFLTTVVTSKADLTDIYAASLSDYIFHFTATSDDWAQDSITFPAEAGTRGKSVAVGNVNHDGSIDLVTTYEGADRKYGVMLSLADDSGWQHYPISDTLGRKFDFAKLIDLDQDGDLDVLTSEENNNSATQGGLGVIWYENPLKPEKHP